MLIHGKAEYRKEDKTATMLEAIPNLGLLESEISPRILNTHLPVRWLPLKHLEKGGKIVHLMRNPKDVAVSMFHHIKSSGEGGVGTRDMTWQQFFDNMVIGEGIFTFLKFGERLQCRNLIFLACYRQSTGP